MAVVILLVKVVNLYCLHMVECCFRDFSEEMGCSMLFADMELHTAAVYMLLLLCV